MPIASIPKDTPVVKPAEGEMTFSYLDLQHLKISESNGIYTLVTRFCPCNEDGSEMLPQVMKLSIRNLASLFAGGEHNDLKLATKNFVKELAKVVQNPPATPPMP